MVEGRASERDLCRSPRVTVAAALAASTQPAATGVDQGGTIMGAVWHVVAEVSGWLFAAFLVIAGTLEALGLVGARAADLEGYLRARVQGLSVVCVGASTLLLTLTEHLGGWLYHAAFWGGMLVGLAGWWSLMRVEREMRKRRQQSDGT
jgi:hypothetical protein